MSFCHRTSFERTHRKREGNNLWERLEFDCRIGPASLALHFYEFQLHSCRKAVDIWIIGLRNKVVKDIRNMIGKTIWDAREEAVYLEEKQSAGDLHAEKRCRVRKYLVVQ
jgi:hypothetical protein